MKWALPSDLTTACLHSRGCGTESVSRVADVHHCASITALAMRPPGQLVRTGWQCRA